MIDAVAVCGVSNQGTVIRVVMFLSLVDEATRVNVKTGLFAKAVAQALGVKVKILRGFCTFRRVRNKMHYWFQNQQKVVGVAWVLVSALLKRARFWFC